MKILQDVDTGYSPSTHYAAKIRCINCGNTYYIAIMKGTTVEKWIEEEVCPNCECIDVLRSAQ